MRPSEGTRVGPSLPGGRPRARTAEWPRACRDQSSEAGRSLGSRCSSVAVGVGQLEVTSVDRDGGGTPYSLQVGGGLVEVAVARQLPGHVMQAGLVSPRPRAPARSPRRRRTAATRPASRARSKVSPTQRPAAQRPRRDRRRRGPTCRCRRSSITACLDPLGDQSLGLVLGNRERDVKRLRRDLHLLARARRGRRPTPRSCS